MYVVHAADTTQNTTPTLQHVKNFTEQYGTWHLPEANTNLCTQQNQMQLCLPFDFDRVFERVF